MKPLSLLCLSLSLISEASSRQGYVDILPANKTAEYKVLLPIVDDVTLSAILNSPETMWYDPTAIVPGYQDSMGDPAGFRPNTIESILIDLAVPGGWSRLFQKRGRFNFPFGTGGADLSSNFEKVNFWSVPKENGKALSVAYWKLSFGRWQWLFPVGTKFGEVMLLKFPDGELRVFEIRVRTRTLTSWTNTVFRPFPTSSDLDNAIRKERPDWAQVSTLVDIIEHLRDNGTLTRKTLSTKHFSGTFSTVEGSIDFLPDFGDPQLVKDLLKKTPFRNTGNRVWKANGGDVSYAASTRASYNIVPTNYDGGLIPVTEDSCHRCHKDAGRQISDFHSDLILYGELWGEDEIFSWHPFETSAFVNANGDVENFNNDNRKLRSDFVSSGLVQPYNSSSHSPSFYKALAREWKYNPVE